MKKIHFSLTEKQATFLHDNPDFDVDGWFLHALDNEIKKSESMQQADKYMFKVATLRNIELTGPYFHDGAEPDLRNAIIRMADMQLGQQLDNMEAIAILEFLKSMTDKELATANAVKTN